MTERYIITEKQQAIYDYEQQRWLSLEEVVEQLNLYEDGLESTAKFLRKIEYWTGDLACIMERQAKEDINESYTND